MTNKDKYAEEILDIACSSVFAVSKESNKPVACNSFSCRKCRFYKRSASSCYEPRIKWLNQEYTEPHVDWSKVAVDTPILVRSSESDKWIRRHFAKFEDGFVYAWSIGKTHWSVGDECNVTDWKYAKLVESEE